MTMILKGIAKTINNYSYSVFYIL